MELAKAGDWEAALNEFLESRRIYATKSATHNAAFALGKLGRFVEAVALYDVLFAEFGSKLEPGESRSFPRERATWLARIGDLEVDIGEPNASVVVDGVERGLTPLAESIKLDEGRHTLHLDKNGFVPLELELQIAGGQHRTLQGSLTRAARTGTLLVRESNGQKFDVLVDSNKMGQTPWQGELTTGTHLVLLLGQRRWGTPPATVEIRADQVTSLTLQAVELGSNLRVEPTPVNGAVFVDDVSVGSGVWSGMLPPGSHRVDVSAVGYLPFHQELWLSAGQSAELRADLERQSNKVTRRVPLVLELNGGAIFSPSFSGGADDACGCSERSPPHGFITGLRIGYLPTRRLALEFGASFLSVSESMTRTMIAHGESSSPTFTASNYKDSTQLRGPLGMLSVSYRMLTKTPLTARMGGGVARLQAHTQNSAEFSGEVVNRSTGERQTVSEPVSITESSRILYVPFVSTELRLGYQFNRMFSADIGASLAVFFPPNVARGGTDTAGSDQLRGTILPNTSTWADGKSVTPGRLTLPVESIAGPFLALAPTIAVQARF